MGQASKAAVVKTLKTALSFPQCRKRVCAGKELTARTFILPSAGTKNQTPRRRYSSMRVDRRLGLLATAVHLHLAAACDQLPPPPPVTPRTSNSRFPLPPNTSLHTPRRPPTVPRDCDPCCYSAHTKRAPLFAAKRTTGRSIASRTSALATVPCMDTASPPQL